MAARKNRGVRFNDEEWDRVNRRAEKMGMSRSAYVRAASLGDVGGRDAPQVRAKLRRLGLRLRETHEAFESSDQEPVDPEMFGRLLEEVRKAVLSVSATQRRAAQERNQQDGSGGGEKRKNMSREEETYEDL